MATNTPPPSSRLREFFGSVPLVTLCLLILCLTIFIIDSVVFDFGDALAACSMSPASVAGELELYRVVTAAFTHGSILHVGMNMISFVSLGSSLEVLFGSLGFAFLISVYTLLVGIGFIGLGTVAATVDRAYWWQSAVGFSGVIFSLAVDECALSPSPTRSIFGLFSVPTRFYPWVLMAALQFILPNISFIGHLSGVLVGLLHVAGALRIFVPTPATLRKIETTWLPTWFVRMAPYKLVPSTEPVIVQDLVPECVSRAARACFAYLGNVSRSLFVAASPMIAMVRGGGANATTTATTAATTTSPTFGSGRLGGGGNATTSSSIGASAPRVSNGNGNENEKTKNNISNGDGDDENDENADAPLLLSSSSSAAGVINSSRLGSDETEADIIAARFQLRGKAAAAAEARAAAAAMTGRPDARTKSNNSAGVSL
jgi:membrane associated rhomboid family serine protease